jgi:hypothetical protein
MIWLSSCSREVPVTYEENIHNEEIHQEISNFAAHFKTIKEQ